MSFAFSDSDEDDLGFLTGLSQGSDGRGQAQKSTLLESETKLVPTSTTLGKKETGKLMSKNVANLSQESVQSLSELISSQKCDSGIQSESSQQEPNSQSSSFVSASQTTALGKGQNGSQSTNKSMSATLPLMYPANFKSSSTLLVQLEDASMDLSGDVGAIGRFHTRGQKGVMLDIKGQQYTGEIIPCASFLVVGMSPTEAKVESIVSDFCQISRKKDTFDAMKGVVTQGVMDETYQYVAEMDVNRKSNNNDDQRLSSTSHETQSISKNTATKSSGKRPRSATTSSANTKTKRKKK